MKRLILFSVIISIISLTACQKDDSISNPIGQELEPNVSIGDTYSENDGTEAIFSIDNKNQEVLENETLLLSNITDNAISYYWDFGNGDSSIDPQPSYKYKMHGHYTVTLTVSDAEGNTRKSSEDVLVLCIFGGGAHDR